MKNIVLTLIALQLVCSSCEKVGCTDPRAINFDSSAEIDDMSCVYSDTVYITDTITLTCDKPPRTYLTCDGSDFTWNDVTNPTTGRTWMDRNLGASRVATSSTDAKAYGDLYQWGRDADGHQCRNSDTTSTIIKNDTPKHGDFILNPNNYPFDWRSPQNDSLWQGVNGINNPCPTGYRVPTEIEWEEEVESWTSKGLDGAFESVLKLPMAGDRYYNSHGWLFNVGTSAYYWSSTASGTAARRVNITSSNTVFKSFYRAYGYSVRCIKD